MENDYKPCVFRTYDCPSPPPPVGSRNRCHLSNGRFNPETVHLFWPQNGFGGRAWHLSCRTDLSRTKNQPKEEVFGTDIPRTSGGHSRGYPDPKLRSGRSKSWKNKHFGADIHDPKARTSTTLRDFQKLRSGKLWAAFSFPNLGV